MFFFSIHIHIYVIIYHNLFRVVVFLLTYSLLFSPDKYLIDLLNIITDSDLVTHLIIALLNLFVLIGMIALLLFCIATLFIVINGVGVDILNSDIEMSNVPSRLFHDFAPKRLTPSKIIASSGKDCSSCLFSFQPKAYPGNFFFHFHIPKTGGTSFRACLKCWDVQSLSFHSERHLLKCSHFDTNTLSMEIQSNTKHAVSCESVSKRGGFMQSLVNNLHISSSVRIITHIRKPLDHIFSALMHYKVNNNRPCETFHDILTNKTCEHYHIDNMQTKSLSSRDAANITEAVDFVSIHAFHFGITEYFRASLCLLAYQLGQLTSSGNMCDCSKNSDVQTKHFNAAKTRTGHVTKSMSNVLSPATHKILQEKFINLDNVLYHVAMQVFLQRVIIAERESGVQLLCLATDGLEIMTLKDSIVNPHWYNGRNV